MFTTFRHFYLDYYYYNNYNIYFSITNQLWKMSTTNGALWGSKLISVVPRQPVSTLLSFLKFISLNVCCFLHLTSIESSELITAYFYSAFVLFYSFQISFNARMSHSHNSTPSTVPLGTQSDPKNSELVIVTVSHSRGSTFSAASHKRHSHLTRIFLIFLQHFSLSFACIILIQLP